MLKNIASRFWKNVINKIDHFVRDDAFSRRTNRIVDFVRGKEVVLDDQQLVLTVADAIPRANVESLNLFSGLLDLIYWLSISVRIGRSRAVCIGSLHKALLPQLIQGDGRVAMSVNSAKLREARVHSAILLDSRHITKQERVFYDETLLSQCLASHLPTHPAPTESALAQTCTSIRFVDIPQMFHWRVVEGTKRMYWYYRSVARQGFQAGSPHD